MTDTRPTKEIYKQWVFEGNCPCCFPYWEHEVSTTDFDVWQWQDEFKAWDVYAEICAEYEDD